MGWAKRLQGIAVSDPSKLPPFLRQGLKPGEPAWARATWQTQGQGDVSPESAARPILAMLGWLGRKGLLTDAGEVALRSQGEITPKSVALTRPLVTDEAAGFLDRHFDEWFNRAGINYAIDPPLTIAPDPYLDELWDQDTLAQRARP